MTQQKRKTFKFYIEIKHYDQDTVENVLEEFLDSWIGRSNYFLDEIDKAEGQEPFDGDR